jgi:hypothetical protein
LLSAPISVGGYLFQVRAAMVLIALLTLSFQTIKAAMMQPGYRSLRTEMSSSTNFRPLAGLTVRNDGELGKLVELLNWLISNKEFGISNWEFERHSGE